MRFYYLKNESGLTMVELIIALGLSSLLLLFVVTSSLFVKKFIRDWSNRDRITEEISFITKELKPKIEKAREIRVTGDSIIFSGSNGKDIIYTLTDSTLLKHGLNILRQGIQLDSLSIQKLPLQNSTDSTILQQDIINSGLYSLTVLLSDKYGNSDTISTVLTNNYEYHKYNKK